MKSTDLLRRAVPLLLVLTASGCAATDSEPTSASDEPTPAERQAGDAWTAGAANGEDPAEDSAAPSSDPNAPRADVDPADDDDARELVTPEEASAKFFEPEDDTVLDADGVPLPRLTPVEIDEIASCRRATGYRKGKAFSICVTTVNGKLVEVNTARAFLRMRKAAKTKGVSIVVVSGFRTMAQQRYLYHCYKTKKCNHGNLAAPPGYSNHQSGHALDLNTSAGGVYSYLAKHGSAYSFRRTVPSERWHWEHW